MDCVRLCSVNKLSHVVSKTRKTRVTLVWQKIKSSKSKVRFGSIVRIFLCKPVWYDSIAELSRTQSIDLVRLKYSSTGMISGSSVPSDFTRTLTRINSIEARLKLSLRLISKRTKIPLSHSRLEVRTYSRRQALENACEFVSTTGFAFTCYWITM